MDLETLQAANKLSERIGSLKQIAVNLDCEQKVDDSKFYHIQTFIDGKFVRLGLLSGKSLKGLMRKELQLTKGKVKALEEKFEEL